MAIPEWLFFSFWATISATFLKLGFSAFNRSHLSTSVPLPITILLKNSLGISLSVSTTYPVTFAPHLDVIFLRYFIWQYMATVTILMLSILLPSIPYFWYFFCYAFFSLIPTLAERGRDSTPVLPGDGVAINVDCIVKVSMYFMNNLNVGYVDDMEFFPMTIMYISFLVYFFWSLAFDERSKPQMSRARQKRDVWKWLPGEGLDDFVIALVYAVFMEKEDSGMLKRMIYRKKQWIQFAVGMMGTILFQNYFRLTTFDHVVAFLYLAVSWLGCLALLRATTDFGIFNFVLGNVIVGCTVSQFGLKGTTWLAYGASLLLYGLRLKLDSEFKTRRENEYLPVSQIAV